MLQQTSPPASQGAAGGAAPLMAAHIYDLLDSFTDTGYWRAAARNELFYHLWRDHRRPPASGGAYQVLDVGCGPGGLLAYLVGRERRSLRPFGVDLFLGTLRRCRERGLGGVAAADATRLPFPDAAFDLIVSQDVMEHVPDDAAMASEVFRVCAAGGLAMVLVPAHQALWSTRDVRLQHCRRYSLAQLDRRLARAGFETVRRTYTDMFLLAPLWAMIRLAKKTPQGVPDMPLDAPGGDGLLNRALTLVSRTEGSFARRACLPFGVAAVVLARKPE